MPTPDSNIGTSEGRSAPSGAQIMREFLPQSPFARELGLEIEDIGAGTAVVRIPFRDEIVTIEDTVHGGVLASLIDVAAMVAAWSGAEIPESLRGSTVSLSVNYVAPAQGEDVTAAARVVRRGRRLATVDVEATTASAGLVAKALVTYQIG